MATSGKPRRIFTIGFYSSLATSAFFFWVWYERYLRFDFNELGRYYDDVNQVVYTDAGFVWVLPAVAFLLLALIRLAIALWWVKVTVPGEESR
jgi:hypothetical protein